MSVMDCQFDRASVIDQTVYISLRVHDIVW